MGRCSSEKGKGKGGEKGLFPGMGGKKNKAGKGEDPREWGVKKNREEK